MKKRMESSFTAILILIATVLISGCGKDDKTNSQNTKGRMGGYNAEVEAVPVKVYTVHKDDISNFILTTTTIEAERLVDIAANSTGQLMEMRVEEGDRVTSGQILAILDKRDLQAAYDESNVRFENNKMLYERAQQLFQKKLVAQQEVDNQKFELESARSQMERAKLNLDYATIRAPFSGVVTQRLVNKGKMIRSNDILFTLADVDPLRAKIYIPEKEMNKISLGQKAKITVESTPGSEFEGTVTLINPVVDPTSGTVKVTIEITKNLDKLRPGMFANVYIVTETHHNALVIPKKALLLDSEDEAVYVYKDGYTQKARLKIGFTSGDNMEILQGLAVGDQIITVGHEGLREGSPVRIKVTEGGQELAANTENPAKKDGSETDAQQGNSSTRQRRGMREVTDDMFNEFLKNPDVKKEWEDRQKEDPEVATDKTKKARFYFEMKMKYPTMEELTQRLEQFLSMDPDLAAEWEKLIKKDPSVETDFTKKKKFVDNAIKKFRSRMGRMR